MLFFVKVRIDLTKLAEMGQKLQTGELDTGHILSTHCIKADPSVGMSIWEAASREDFEKYIAPFNAYYTEVMEITPVITAEEAKQLLMKQMAGSV